MNETASETELTLHPAWREAVERFIREHNEPGKIIEHGWFYDAFEIERPTPEMASRDAEKIKLLRLAAFTPFAETLLKDYQIHLEPKAGVGYRVIPAPEQTGYAERRGLSDIKTVLRRTRDRLANVDLARLSANERSANAAALARTSMFSSAYQKIEKDRRASLLGDPAND